MVREEKRARLVSGGVLHTTRASRTGKIRLGGHKVPKGPRDRGVGMQEKKSQKWVGKEGKEGKAGEREKKGRVWGVCVVGTINRLGDGRYWGFW